MILFIYLIAIARKNDQEIISNKKSQLNIYLKQFLRIPEILISDIFMHFIDEESTNGDIVLDDNVDITAIDILLSEEKYNKHLTLKNYIITITPDIDSVILYSFQLPKRDIGFSIELNNKEIATYQRHEFNYPSQPVDGFLFVKEPGSYIFKWDNSYSKLRSKNLRYLLKVYSKSDFNMAVNLAKEAVTKRNGFANQRSMVYKSFLAINQESNYLYNNNSLHSNRFLSSDLEYENIPNDNYHDTELDMSESDFNKETSEISKTFKFDESMKNLNLIDSLEKMEINQLRDEKRSLQMALSLSESTLNDERTKVRFLYKYLKIKI
jgi:hypothetical protein